MLIVLSIIVLRKPIDPLVIDTCYPVVVELFLNFGEKILWLCSRTIHALRWLEFQHIHMDSGSFSVRKENW